MFNPTIKTFERETIKVEGNENVRVTLSDEMLIQGCHIGDEFVSYREHRLWVTVQKNVSGTWVTVQDSISDKYTEDDNEECRKNARLVAEIDMNCIMLAYGI